MSLRLVWVFVCFSLCLAVPRPVLAQPQERLARTHFDAGSSYYEQGRYEEALREFQEAHQVAPDALKPLLLFNVGQAQERLGRIADALASFRRYLESAPPSERALIEARIRTLQGRLDSTAIMLAVSEPGAAVWIDGEERGQTPLAEPLRVQPGTHEVRIEKAGFQPFTLRVMVPAGEAMQAEATLVPAPTPPPPPSEPEATPTEATSGEPTASEPGDGHSEPPSRLYTWVVAAVAGAAVVGGSVLGIMALGRADDALAATSTATHDDEASSARALALFSDISFGLAAVGAGAAVALYFIEGRPSEQRARAIRFTPFVLADGAGAAVGGAF